jgi:hypothetical protein
MRSSSLLFLLLLCGCITPAPPAPEHPEPVRTPQIEAIAHPRAVANRVLLHLLTRAQPKGRVAVICDSTHTYTREVARLLEAKLRQERGIQIVRDGQTNLILSVANSADTLRCELRNSGSPKPHWHYESALRSD